MEASVTAFGESVILSLNCAKSLSRGTSRVVKMPRLRCIGKMNLSLGMAAATPTEMASCPIPLNHLLILPCRNCDIIF